MLPRTGGPGSRSPGCGGPGCGGAGNGGPVGGGPGVGVIIQNFVKLALSLIVMIRTRRVFQILCGSQNVTLRPKLKFSVQTKCEFSQ